MSEMKMHDQLPNKAGWYWHWDFSGMEKMAFVDPIKGCVTFYDPGKAPDACWVRSDSEKSRHVGRWFGPFEPPRASQGNSINHPSHYGGGDNPYEAIKVIEAWGLGFCLGNVVKYVARAGKKGDTLEDLKKAAWYLDREIKRMDGPGVRFTEKE